MSKSPDLSVISRSEMHPPQASDTKLTKPDGVHPTNIFHVFLLLYCEYVTEELTSPDGR